MKFLLDENIPVQLFRRLSAATHDVEHIIVSGNRGMADSVIRSRLATEHDLVFLTQDTEFLDLLPVRGTVVVSRVPQRLPISDRVDVWFTALHAFLGSPPAGNLFELLPTGELVAWTPSS